MVTVSPEHQCPLFSLEHLSSDYGLNLCNKDEAASLAATLAKLSKITWAQINSSPRHGLGTEKIERHSLRYPLPASVPEDANIIAFRFCGKAPMLGFREGRIFHIVLLDPKFEAYDHG